MNARVPAHDRRLAIPLQVKGRQAALLRRYANVSGVGVGFKEVGGRVTDQIALRVYVTKKVSARELSSADLLPASMDSIPIDVIEVRFRAHDDPGEHQRRQQVLQGGISVGNLLLGGSGTMAAAVFDGVTGQQMLLSNWHVLCGRLDCEVGEPVTQPGNGGGDSGNAGDIVARLARWRFDEDVDAAVAVLSGHRFATDELFHLGRVAVRPVAAELGMSVTKSGRTTGVTTGRVTDISADVDVGYGGAIGTRTLRNQLVIKDGDQVSRPGDSGSLWVDDALHPVGLNFAGGDGGQHAIANPIQSVLEALQIHFGPGAMLQDYVVQAASV